MKEREEHRRCGSSGKGEKVNGEEEVGELGGWRERESGEETIGRGRR